MVSLCVCTHKPKGTISISKRKCPRWGRGTDCGEAAPVTWVSFLLWVFSFVTVICAVQQAPLAFCPLDLWWDRLRAVGGWEGSTAVLLLSLLLLELPSSPSNLFRSFSSSLFSSPFFCLPLYFSLLFLICSLTLSDYLSLLNHVLKSRFFSSQIYNPRQRPLFFYSSNLKTQSSERTPIILHLWSDVVIITMLTSAVRS